jgi:hypothetical protein
VVRWGGSVPRCVWSTVLLHVKYSVATVAVVRTTETMSFGTTTI